MTKGSARQLRKLVNTTLRRSGAVTETTTESAGEAGSVSREAIEASVSALDEQLVKSAGGRDRLTEDDNSVVKLGRDATQKLINEGPSASLTPDEEMALEAIAIADGSRPALLIQNDAIDPSDAKAAEWADELSGYQAAIHAIAPSVGRIDSNGRHIGTGWMIRPGYIVTNRHVAQVLSNDQTAQQLVLNEQNNATICFGCEAGEAAPRPRHPIMEILFSGIEHIDLRPGHFGKQDFAKLDLAVLKLDPNDLGRLPSALPSTVIAAAEITPGLDLYALGYPGPTSHSYLPQKTLLRLLGEHVSIKRLSPGETIIGLGAIIGDTRKRTIAHDATTLGGSSGSVIVGFDDLGKAKLIGLHFGGYEVRYGPTGEVEYRGRNYAHCLAAMADVIREVDTAIAADRDRSRKYHRQLTPFHLDDQQGFREEKNVAHPIQFGLTPEKISNWLRNLERFDPDLAKSINARTAAMKPAARQKMGLEAAVAEAAPPLDVPMTIETMVRPGRPVVPIKGDTVVGTPAFIEPPDGEMMVQRLLAAADNIKPVIPLVGRIDVANFPRNASFIGSGWLIAPDIVVTNSHVAELIGRRDGRRFTFLPGRFGDPIVTTVNWKHEMDGDSSVASPVESIIFIESRQVADIAFLKIGRRSDGARQDCILLADTDAAAGTSVAVIGYPARAGEDVIPDQAWMERVFGGRYDVKRAAPGIVMPNSRGWATHDCTTLGGNSGSAVIDLATGKAVALHFAGAYVLENYAVPASTIRDYLKRRPWEAPETVVTDRGSSGQVTAGGAQTTAPTATAATGQPGSVSITLPLTITVSIGSPIAGGGFAPATATESAPIEDAVRRFAAAFRGDGILAVRSGLVVNNGEFTDTPCVNVVTHPDKIAAVRARVPAAYLGHPVDVRTAGIVDMLGGPNLVSEAAVTSIAYNDDDRTGANFSFGQVNEEMELTCCVGPERSWSVLSDYIANAKGRMVSSMYEFHAEHVADAIQERLENGIKMDLALDNATRVTRAGVGDGDFNRKTVFRKWARDFSFDRIYVPEGPNGLIADSYHIKVTVDDNDRLWLSSGNWKNSSQPNIEPADLNNLRAIRAKKGNREWHVVIKNKTLATRYRSHILADLEFSKENGGTEEAVVEDVLVDVPFAMEESVAFELEARAASRIFDPITIDRRVKVKPLLTPDKRGKVYTDAVLDLIESADDELLFQIPYINSFKDSATGNLEKLVEALIRKSKEINIVQVILRSDHGTWIPCAEDLKKRGLNLNKCLRHLPSTHTKGMIVDGRRCLVGSHNWSGNGVTLNRDASLLFDDADVAQYFRQAFELDWDRASRPVIPESAITETPRIADPESAVPQGFRRMTLEEFLEG